MMSGKARERAVAAFADATMTEIRADMESGLVPRTVTSFSELHDYVDANDYAPGAVPFSGPECTCVRTTASPGCDCDGLVGVADAGGFPVGGGRGPLHLATTFGLDPKAAIRYAQNARQLLITAAEEQDPAASGEPKDPVSP